MQFTGALLQRLEQNSTLKSSYLNAGSLGKNKLVAIPVVLLVLGLFGAYECYDLSRVDGSYTTYMQVCLGLVVVCLIAIVIMQRGAKKQVAANIDDVPVCIAKKITGNDNAQIYYGIYTPGAKRHDIEFIETIADRIAHIYEHPDADLRKTIIKMFEPKLADTNSHAVRLPDDITDGQEVYQRQFYFGVAGDDMKNMIEENEGRFVVLAFNETNAVQVRAKDILAS